MGTRRGWLPEAQGPVQVRTAQPVAELSSGGLLLPLEEFGCTGAGTRLGESRGPRSGAGRERCSGGVHTAFRAGAARSRRGRVQAGGRGLAGCRLPVHGAGTSVRTVLRLLQRNWPSPGCRGRVGQGQEATGGGGVDSRASGTPRTLARASGWEACHGAGRGAWGGVRSGTSCPRRLGLCCCPRPRRVVGLELGREAWASHLLGQRGPRNKGTSSRAPSWLSGAWITP